MIEPVKLHVGVKRVRRVNGGGIMIECLRESEAQKLKMAITKQLELKNLEPRAPKQTPENNYLRVK